MTKEQMQATGYRGVFRDCYRYLQSYGDVEGSAAYWEAAARDASTISNYYKKTQAGKLAAAMLNAIYEELQRKENRLGAGEKKRYRGGKR